MKKLFFLLFLPVFIWITPCKGEGIHQSSFQSIDDVIRFETSQILDADPNNPEFLSEMYLSRAESYLLYGNNSLAYADFKEGYAIADLCSEETKMSLHFRALFGLAIVYGCEEMTDELYATADSLKLLLSSCKCNCNQDKQSQLTGNGLSHHIYGVKPILGPDQIPIQDCIDFAESTAEKCRYLIALVPKAQVQVTLQILVDDLAKRARSCCRAGGIWKACLQPIVDKWQLWNEKWNLFKIPPDPAWD